MDGYQRRSNPPWVLHTKEPVDNSHEVDLPTLCQEATKEIFDNRIFREVYKVVYVESQWKRIHKFSARRIGRILNETRIKTGIFQQWSKVDRLKDWVYLILQGLHCKPYRVQNSSHYSWGAAGSPEGGWMMVTFSGGRKSWQNAFLQLPWWRGLCFWTAMLTRKWKESLWRTDINLSNFNHTLSSWLPRITMQDFAQWGSKFLSLLIVRTHMVGIAWGVPFSPRARYLPRVILQ